MLNDVKQTQKVRKQSITLLFAGIIEWWVSIILARAIAFVAIDNNVRYLNPENPKWRIANKIAYLKGANFQTGFLENIFQKQSLQLVTDRGLTLPSLFGRYELSNKYQTLFLEGLNLYAF